MQSETRTSDTVKRRDFHKLTMAALGGLVAGTAVSSAQAQKKDENPKLKVDPGLLMQEPHTCKGLNTCKGKGKGEKNACAGQGACGTAKAHDCKGMNDCKGQGGCGGYPGQNNTCKGSGHCAVPLSKDSWALARKQFEQLMTDAGKKVGPAPK